MKIGVISDTHLRGPDGLLEKIAGTLFGDADLILHAGDLVEPEVLAVFSGRPVLAVAGNMDSPAVREAFPGKRVFSSGRFRIGLIHGWGPPDGIEERLARVFRDDPVDCLVYGHTHRPANHLRNGVLFFNPGSAGGAFTARRTVGILEITDRIAGSIIELEDGTS